MPQRAPISKETVSQAKVLIAHHFPPGSYIKKYVHQFKNGTKYRIKLFALRVMNTKDILDAAQALRRHLKSAGIQYKVDVKTSKDSSNRTHTNLHVWLV